MCVCVHFGAGFYTHTAVNVQDRELEIFSGLGARLSSLHLEGMRSVGFAN